MKRGLLIFCAVSVLFWAAALAVKGCIARRPPYSPLRPANISSNATYIQGPDGHGFWESCAVTPTAVQCAIATAEGTMLHNEAFIPYRGALPRNQDDIVITEKSGGGWISLANGTYLIPAEHNEASKRFLDFMIGDAKHF